MHKFQSTVFIEHLLTQRLRAVRDPSPPRVKETDTYFSSLSWPRLTTARSSEGTVDTRTNIIELPTITTKLLIPVTLSSTRENNEQMH